MTRAETEQYLGKEVEVTLYDGTIVQGVLLKTGNYYFCEPEEDEITCCFRVSHIKEIKEIWRVHYE